MIIIYVDGMQVLAPLECLYVPTFEKDIARRDEGGIQSSDGESISKSDGVSRDSSLRSE